MEEPVIVVVLEHQAPWPELQGETAPPSASVQAIEQRADETPEELARRVERLLDQMQRQHLSAVIALLACNDRVDASVLKGRASVARHLLAVAPSCTLSAAKTCHARAQLVSLAQQLNEHWGDEAPRVNVSFGRAVKTEPPPSRSSAAA